MLVMHCVFHRENLIAETVSPKLHKILHCVIKCTCINSTKENCKAERLFQKFCEANHADYARLLLTPK